MSEFDKKARNWDTPTAVHRAQKIAEKIKQQITITPGMTAFEYGCGTGLLSFALKDYFKHIKLTDVSDGMLRVLDEKIRTENAANMTFGKLDLTAEPAPPGEYYDIIYTMMAMHHVSDVPGVIKKFHRMLKPGGILCIADLDKEDGSFHGKDVTNVHRGFDRREFEKHISRAGFADILFSDAYEMEHENKYGEKGRFSIFLMTAVKED